MINHENGHARPTYFTIKDKDVLGFIPLSSKVSKYQPIYGGKGYTSEAIIEIMKFLFSQGYENILCGYDANSK